MFTSFKRFRSITYKLQLILFVVAIAMITGARAEEIIKNDVEDVNLLISSLLGGQSNILVILDSSGSMGLNFGGDQVAKWAQHSNVAYCEYFWGNSYDRAQCIANATGTSPCGSISCTSKGGVCDNQEDFESFLQCIESPTDPRDGVSPWYGDLVGNGNANDSIVDDIYQKVVVEECGSPISDPNPRTYCDTVSEWQKAAAALDAYALKLAHDDEPSTFPLDCASQYCAGGSEAYCDTTEYNDFKTCMQSNRIQPTSTSCTNGEDCSHGEYGSTRMDGALAAFFDLLDADDSLGDVLCDDPSMMFDGSNNSITCLDYMYTPFRDVRQIVKGTGTSSKLPITARQDKPLLDVLNDDDADILGFRFRPMTYGGRNSGGGCNSASIPQGGFAGSSKADLDNVWKFFRDIQPFGGTPLANTLGFDDNNSPNSTIGKDALSAFRVELQTDPAISCRPEFAIVITDGQDTCSGESPTYNTGRTTGNSNRRSTIQAVSNLRTYYTRNPVQNRGSTHKKEILTFVIALGIKSEEAIRNLNAMALAGGTHTEGIINHIGPDGVPLTSGVDITQKLPGTSNEGLRALATAEVNLSNLSNGAGAVTLQGCLTPVEDSGITGQGQGAHCSIGSYDLFHNYFFENPGPLESTTAGSSFAFFVNTPQELVQALETIFGYATTFSTTGTAPTAPQSSTAVAARDRIFLSILRPLTDERFWQGRLGLYSFVPVPNEPGTRTIIRRPESGHNLNNASTVSSLSIFADDGSLNTNAQYFFWDAGKELAERDIAADPRRIFTVDRANDVDEETNGSLVERIRYEGERMDFCLDGTTGCTNGLDLTDFGISDDDVTDPIPVFCRGNTLSGGEPNIGAVADCSADCATTPFTTACNDCVKGCIATKIVDFFSGNTYIETRGDPLGIPSTGTCPSPDGFFGCDCPDFNNDPFTGSFSQCSVRLGDIFHGAPVLVASPNPLFFDVGFQAFGAGVRERSAAVYINANDGGIHSFHAGELQDASPSNPIRNPFTNQDETVPFFNQGSGRELFMFITPSFQPDSISDNGPFTPADPSGTSVTGIPPDYRFGDMKSFMTENLVQRSWFDGTPLVADVFIDGYDNGVPDTANLCQSVDADGEIDVCGREWHSVLLTGYRNGGGAYTALDVTNPKCSQTDCNTFDDNSIHLTNGSEYPRHLWTLFDKDFGNSWSDVTIGRARMQTEIGGSTIFADRWLMFVGGGLDPIDTDPLNGVQFGNAFYAVDITTGQIVFKFHPNDPIPTNFPDPDNNTDHMTCDMAAKVGAFDLNNDGYIDVVYAGDTCGRLWEFDVSMPIIDTDSNVANTGGPPADQSGLDPDIEASDWTGHIAFCAVDDITDCNNPANIATDEREPIFYAPTVILDDLGRRHVIVGTGSRRNPTSLEQFGRLYNFVDPFIPAFLAGGGAVGATTKLRSDFDSGSGQVLDLVPTGNGDNFFEIQGTDPQNNQGEFMVNFPNNIGTSGGTTTSSPQGEKAVGTPVVVNRVLIFTTFAPPNDNNAGNACLAGLGEGRIFALDYLSGLPALNRVPGASGLLGTQTNPDDISGLTAAEGMPAPAQLTYGTRGSVLLTVAFSGGPSVGGATFFVWELPPFPSRTQTLYWEEIL